MNGMRSDLAIELCEGLKENNCLPEGIECKTEKDGDVVIETVCIKSERASRLCGKPQGTYKTLGLGKIWLEEAERFRGKVESLRRALLSMLPAKAKSRGTVLVAGLGNRSITADAIGPIAVEKLVVTRHIRKLTPQLFEQLGLGEVCAITPGVLGETGIESADIIRSVTKQVKPDLLIAIDALASRSPDRLATTIQLCDTGIYPGSGVGNERPALLPEELKIPVLTIGVPTVVDAATLAADAASRLGKVSIDPEALRQEWKSSEMNFFVTPKETDQIIRVMGSLIGYAINLAWNENLSYEEMLALVG